MQSFTLAPVSKSTLIWQLLILAIPPVILVGLLMVPEFRSDLRLSIPLGLTLVLTTVGIALFTRRRRIQIDGGQLRVAATFYTWKHAIADLDLEHSRVLSLDEHTHLRPMIKTNGYSLPGFHAGHFRSKQWQKLFCLVTNPSVLLIPLKHRNGALLLSPEHPRQLQNALLEPVRD